MICLTSVRSGKRTETFAPIGVSRPWLDEGHRRTPIQWPAEGS